MAMREMRRVGLLDALDYCTLLAAEAPDRYDRPLVAGSACSWLSVDR
jgi:hypothetical protein